MEAAVESSPDLADALARIESMDLPVDIWAPDVLRHNDRLIDRDKLLKRPEERLESKNVDVASEIEIPKTPFFARTGHMLSLEDRITCHATVGTFATKIESCLSGIVSLLMEQCSRSRSSSGA
jgi:hypothetical protein